MYNKFRFGNDGVMRTVVELADRSCLEVRRGDITWTRAFRAAHPEVQQCRWSSLQAWWASLPVEMKLVETWHASGGWTGPPAAKRGAHVFGLSTHLAYFLRCDYATEEQILEGVHQFIVFTTGVNLRCDFLYDFPVLEFFFSTRGVITIDSLLESGHVFEPRDNDSVTQGYLLSWPSVEEFNRSGLRPVLDDTEDSLEFGPAMTYFMGGWCRGTWSDIQRVYEAYMASKGGIHPLVEAGSIVTDAFLRHMVQTKDKVLSWSAFRRLLLDRGLVWSVIIVKEPLPELIVEPVSVEKPVARRLSFGSVPMDIDYDASWPEPDAVTHSVAEISSFMARVEEQKASATDAAVAATDAVLDEINMLFDHVIEEMVRSSAPDYRVCLVEEFAKICLHDRYTVMWRTNIFERIRMRAAFRAWMTEGSFVGKPNAVLQNFLDTYPTI